MQNFRGLGAPPPDPRASSGWGLRPQTPKHSPPPLRIPGYAPVFDCIVANIYCQPCWAASTSSKSWKSNKTRNNGFQWCLFEHFFSFLWYTFTQSWAPATWKVAALPLFGKKSSGAAAYRYSNKKVAPLPLLACKTAAAAATLKK